MQAKTTCLQTTGGFREALDSWVMWVKIWTKTHEISLQRHIMKVLSNGWVSQSTVGQKVLSISTSLIDNMKDSFQMCYFPMTWQHKGSLHTSCWARALAILKQGPVVELMQVKVTSKEGGRTNHLLTWFCALRCECRSSCSMLVQSLGTQCMCVHVRNGWRAAETHIAKKNPKPIRRNKISYYGNKLLPLLNISLKGKAAELGQDTEPDSTGSCLTYLQNTHISPIRRLHSCGTTEVKSGCSCFLAHVFISFSLKT